MSVAGGLVCPRCNSDALAAVRGRRGVPQVGFNWYARRVRCQVCNERMMIFSFIVDEVTAPMAEEVVIANSEGADR